MAEQDDELEIPRAKAQRAKAETPEAPKAPVTLVRVARAVQLNSDAFIDPPSKPQKLQPGDVVDLKPERARQLLERGVVHPA